MGWQSAAEVVSWRVAVRAHGLGHLVLPKVHMFKIIIKNFVRIKYNIMIILHLAFAMENLASLALRRFPDVVCRFRLSGSGYGGGAAAPIQFSAMKCVMKLQ